MSPVVIPGIPYAAPPRAAAVASALAWPPRLVVIHDTGNTASAAAEANYAAARTDAQANWTSAHAYIDGGGPLGSLPLNLQAWAAFSYANQHGIHLEMCGMNAGAPGAVPPGTIAATARLTAQLCDLAGIPKVKLTPAQVAAGARGVCGHLDITVGLGVGDHDDPGPAFDWAAFMAAVNNGGTRPMSILDDGTVANDLIYGVKNLLDGKDPTQRSDGQPNVLHQKLAAILAKLDEPTPVALTDADRQDIAARILAGMPAGLTAAELVDEFARRLAAGQITLGG